MSTADLEDALKTTFLDYKLSRGEKRGLSRVVEQFAGDAHSLGLARSYAFRLAREQLNGPDAVEAFKWLEDVAQSTWCMGPMYLASRNKRTNDRQRGRTKNLRIPRRNYNVLFALIDRAS